MLIGGMRMGILSGLFKSRDKPQDQAISPGIEFLFGRSTAGKPVNERTALQTTAVYSCVRILAEAIASLPLHVYGNLVYAWQVLTLNHRLHIHVAEMCHLGLQIIA